MLRSVLPLGFIAASRFFGLFIILPVLSLYALELDGANEFLAGLTIGAYAITQMIFQLPFGSLSDRFGRKFMIFVGLIIFIIGSLICAISAVLKTNKLSFTLNFFPLNSVGELSLIVTSYNSFIPEKLSTIIPPPYTFSINKVVNYKKAIIK